MPARILVMEDNPPSLTLMVYLLEKAGHTLLSAADGMEGLEAVRRERPDLVLMDLQMPGLDGYEVARAVKLDPDLRAIPLVAVTAVAMVGDRERVLAAGFDDYLTKPIVPETFAEQVAGFLDPAHRPPSRPPTLAAAVTAPPQSEPPVRQVTSPTARRPVVLVVDNVPDNLAFFRSVLEPFGFDLVVAHNLEEALVRAREGPDLVLSDVHMPGGNGWELIAAVKTTPRLAHIPVVLISSSFWTQYDSERVLAAGAADVIQRPVEPDELVRRLVAFLPEAEVG